VSACKAELQQSVFAGIDGCPAGWVCVLIDADSRWRVSLIAIDAVANVAAGAASVFIDIPIGLLDAGPAERVCDRDARRALGRKRGSSVFPAPARASLRARSYAEALSVNRHRSGRGLSKQSWLIAPKIRVIDELLRTAPALRKRLHEAHPEVCFWALNGAVPMQHNKKTEAGHGERMAVLQRFFSGADAVLLDATKKYRRREMARDDIVDAMVLAVSARLGYGKYRSFPVEVPTDEAGLPMAISYYLPG
jgi:predicted RNase H-like nuclease